MVHVSKYVYVHCGVISSETMYLQHIKFYTTDYIPLGLGSCTLKASTAALDCSVK